MHEDISIVELVDSLVHEAITLGASDIHAEPTEHGLRIRYRIDGVLHDKKNISRDLMLQVSSRFKVLAHINITEKRIPQDGKFSITIHGRQVDLRVSTFPGMYGEKLVVRILDRSATMIDLAALGFEDDMLVTIKRLLSASSGFFLVAGPTGSGKTTTLYAALSFLNSAEKNIITLEDPIEYHVHGITQGQIHPLAGFTFEKGIRAMLRQDPDIVMVGEMRDSQTAQVAVEAALTGHMVLSTVHTTNAPSVIMRLMDMGIEPFLINAVVTGVLAQRLARKICIDCKVAYEPDVHERELMARLHMDIKTLYKGTGCDSCQGLGYRGRMGIFELVIMTSQLRDLIVRHPSFDAIFQQALHDGMQTLLMDGQRKVAQGLITLQELMKAIF